MCVSEIWGERESQEFAITHPDHWNGKVQKSLVRNWFREIRLQLHPTGCIEHIFMPSGQRFPAHSRAPRRADRKLLHISFYPQITIPFLSLIKQPSSLPSPFPNPLSSVRMPNNADLHTFHHPVYNYSTSDLLSDTHHESENEEPSLEAGVFHGPGNSPFDAHYLDQDPHLPNALAGSIDWETITPSTSGVTRPSSQEALGDAGVFGSVPAAYSTYSVSFRAFVLSSRHLSYILERILQSGFTPYRGRIRISDHGSACPFLSHRTDDKPRGRRQPSSSALGNGMSIGFGYDIHESIAVQAVERPPGS